MYSRVNFQCISPRENDRPRKTGPVPPTSEALSFRIGALEAIVLISLAPRNGAKAAPNPFTKYVEEGKYAARRSALRHLPRGIRRESLCAIQCVQRGTARERD